MYQAEAGASADPKIKKTLAAVNDNAADSSRPRWEPRLV